MTAFSKHKVVAALPATLDPNGVYYVRTGLGLVIYVADSTGTTAHPLNNRMSYSFSARIRLQSYWSTFNYGQGHNAPTMTQNVGSGATPAYNLLQARGFLLNAGDRLRSVETIVRAANANSGDIEYRADLVELSTGTGAGANIGTHTLAGIGHNLTNVSLAFNVDMTPTAPSVLMLSARATTGPNNNRYLAVTGRVVFEQALVI